MHLFNYLKILDALSFALYVSLCLFPPPSSDFHGELEECVKYPLNPWSKTTNCKPDQGHNITHVEQSDCEKE